MFKVPVSTEPTRPCSLEEGNPRQMFHHFTRDTEYPLLTFCRPSNVSLSLVTNTSRASIGHDYWMSSPFAGISEYSWGF